MISKIKIQMIRWGVLAGLAFLVIFACDSDEKSSYWDEVVMETNSNSLVFLFTSSSVPPAGDLGLPVMEKTKNGQVTGVDGNKLFYLSLYPRTTDQLYSPFAENLLFKYDENGDNTFEKYPSFVNNLKNYSYDLDPFHASLIEHQNKFSALRVGNLIRAQGTLLKMYVKLNYLIPHDKKHSVAIYIYEKQKVSPQKTIASGEVANFVHKNVLVGFVGGEMFGTPISGSYGMNHKNEFLFNYDIGEMDIENVGVLTIVYELDDNNQPIGVHTVTSN